MHMPLSNQEASCDVTTPSQTHQANQTFEVQDWFSEAPVAMIILNEEGFITAFNQLAFQLFNAPYDQLTRAHFSTFIPALKPSDSLKKIRTKISKIGKAASEASAHLQCRNFTGKVFPLSVKAHWITGYNMDVGLLVIWDDSLAKKTQQELKTLQQGLEFKVKIRTIELAEKVRELDAAKNRLKKTLSELNQTQEVLIQSEKMAALGGLVAGISHEINTPVGIGVTAISHLEDKLGDIKKKYDCQTMDRGDLESFFNIVTESSNIIAVNLKRASVLINSFKQIAVDQSNDDMREFDLEEYIQEIILSLKPNLKKNSVEITLSMASSITMLSYPGSIAQVITNLIMNSLIHAFPGRQEKYINIEISENDENILLKFTDNGVGMTSETTEKIFDPFFTTRRGQGGSGLGLHLVFNIINKILQGKISCTSAVGEGTEFEILIPMKVKEL